MEIKSKARGKIQLPTGCKATIENNQIIIEEEQKQEEFKDGDILISKYTNSVAFFDELTVKGLKWNAESKIMENLI